jgi:hypothetical protein
LNPPELTRIQTAQTRVLTNLMSPTRFTRLIEQESIDKVNAYRAVDFMADVRKGVFSELDKAPVAIGATRRGLQRAYVELMNEKLNGRAPVADDSRAFIRGELKALSAQIAAALSRTADRATRLHLEDARDQIAKALDPKFQPAAPAAAGAAARPGLADELESWPLAGQMSCWPDYAIRVKK